jgi:hypothetical protein
MNLENPFDGSYANPYAAASFAPFAVFSLLGKLSGLPSAGVFLYLAAMTVAIIWSVWFATRHMALDKRLILFSALTFFAPPILMALDRGNSVGFLVPLLVWYFSALRGQKDMQLVLAVCFMSLIKPHLTVLALAPWIAGRLKVAISAISFSAFSNILSFLLFWPNFFPENIFQWILSLSAYQGYSSINNPVPQNMSFAQGVYVLLYGLKEVFGIDTVQPLLETSGNWSSLVGFVVFLSLVIMLTIFRKSLSITQISVMLIAGISLLSSTNYYYYGVFAVSSLLALEAQNAVSIRDKSNKGVSERVSSLNDSVNQILWLACIGTLTQIPILGWVIGNEVVTSAAISGIYWIIAYVFIGTVVVRNSGRSTELRF